MNILLILSKIPDSHFSLKRDEIRSQPAVAPYGSQARRRRTATLCINMKPKQTLILCVTTFFLVISVVINVWQYSRLKPLAKSCTHDLVLMRAMPMIGILSQTNQAWSGDESLGHVLHATWVIFDTSVSERETYRSLGFVADNDVERSIDRHIGEFQKMHNHPVHATGKPAPDR